MRPYPRPSAEETNREVERKCAQQAEDEEEEVLEKQRVRAEGRDAGGTGAGRGFLDARPGQVDIEEEEQDTDADYGALCTL